MQSTFSTIKRAVITALFYLNLVKITCILYFCIIQVNGVIIVGRIMAIDYGRKRVGVAVTDPLKIIATSLETVKTSEIWNFLEDYLKNEQIEHFIVGHPRKMDGSLSESMEFIQPFVNKLKKKYGNIPIEYFDERFTSKIAMQSMIEGGVKKMARRDKSMVDKISANLILQDYLNYKKNEMR